MKKIILFVTFICSCFLPVYANKIKLAILAKNIIEHPEQTFNFIGFLIDLFFACIPIAIIAGIVSIILKSVFDFDRETVIESFLIIAGILLAIYLLIYFFV